MTTYNGHTNAEKLLVTFCTPSQKVQYQKTKTTSNLIKLYWKYVE